MQDQVVRLSKSSYGKVFVIFQVVVPLLLHISYYVNYANFGNTGPQILVFVSASLNCPDFLFHIVIVSGLNYHNTYFNLVLHIPRPIFSL